MNKTLIIIKREYLTRVRNKSFIILTLLIPFLFVGFALVVGFIAKGNLDNKHIAVLDESRVFENKLQNSAKVSYEYVSGSLPETKKSFDPKKYSALLYIPQFDKLNKELNFELYYDEQIGLGAEKSITGQLDDILTEQRMKDAGISMEQLKVLQSKSISLRTINIKDGKDSSNSLAMGIGYACGMILYVFMFFYGMNVLRSVMEEKTNRIAEIIVSSVKPFQLMLGKIIGVALVGLTQVLIWIVLIGVFSAVGLPMMSGGMAMSPEMAGMGVAGNPAALPDEGALTTIMAVLKSTNWTMIVLWFLFYFLGGYFLYASLFAAVGSLVNEDTQESSQFTFPITIPIVFAFIIMTSAINNPNSGLAIFGSLFPLTSPIVMMARIPFGDVPVWQLITSALLLVLGFLGTTWMAAKIYRTGILLYGKKVTFKEVGKWLFK